MPDEIDQAQDHIEKSMAAALEAQRHKRDVMPPNGKCYNCDAPLESDLHRFCDTECRDDFQIRNRRR